MGFFSILGSGPDINRAEELLAQTPGAKLVDVRTPGEYRSGHIKGSVCIPLDQLEDQIGTVVPCRDTPLYLYCRSGARSGRALMVLKDLGYTNLTNLGGVMSWRGELERC